MNNNVLARKLVLSSRPIAGGFFKCKNNLGEGEWEKFCGEPVTELNQFLNVNLTPPLLDGQVLLYDVNTSRWINAFSPRFLDELSDVTVPSPSSVQELYYNGSAWASRNVATTTSHATSAVLSAPYTLNQHAHITANNVTLTFPTPVAADVGKIVTITSEANASQLDFAGGNDLLAIDGTVITPLPFQFSNTTKGGYVQFLIKTLTQFQILVSKSYV